ASRGRSRVPGLAGPHLGEEAVFPDLLVRISGKKPSSRSCWSASQGRSHLPGLAGPHLGEEAIFPDLLVRISGKKRSSRTCLSASRGIRAWIKSAFSRSNCSSCGDRTKHDAEA